MHRNWFSPQNSGVSSSTSLTEPVQGHYMRHKITRRKARETTKRQAIAAQLRTRTAGTQLAPWCRYHKSSWRCRRAGEESHMLHGSCKLVQVSGLPQRALEQYS
ncbi:hypothetical protein AG1IA_07894 [Rhizoctonia solani AG-1 IA]|uniref:Uncharacterized protein n=1 Tax=Thanatephorus cucumeris (strain AG1-IA) TaxID=983506 RepID=L8WMP9_THACA|nr:hypothetical protein AG1IA_07894 [Rhizoctonia solani AG-1 IA]